MSLLVTEDSPLTAAGPADLPQRYSTSTTASTQTVVAYPYTGDYRIDTLLEGVTGQSGLGALVYRWNEPQSLGATVQVSYSFMSAAPVYGGGTDASTGDSGFQPFNDLQKTAVHQIMAQLSQELGINLVEVGDSAASYGQIRFGNNYQETSSGYSWLPYSTPDDRGGDVWLDLWTPSNLSDLAPGGVGYGTLLHEIGHALGLKHPGDYNAGSAATGAPGNYLGTAEDNETYTVMSYTAAPTGGQQRDWYGLYDLLALKFVYGSRNYNAGDTVYSFNDASGRLLKIIDDGSGFDTIDISSVSSAGNRVVDMRPGAFSSVGVNGAVKAVKNLSIDFSTVVEKFIGTPYADSVTGNDANNQFILGVGANTADGGAGIDTVFYAAPRAGYIVSANGANLQVAGGSVNDTLSNVERLVFTDRKLAFDLSGNAGIAAKILGAVFDAPALSNAGYVGIGLSALDAGAGYQDLMAFALDARLGSSHGNAQVVDLLYTNVAGVAPTADQAAPYLAQLNAGALTQAGLGVFAAETAENAAQIGLVGLAQTGIAYA